MIYNYKKFYFAIIIVFFIFLVGNFCLASFLKDDTKLKVGAYTNVASFVGGYETSTGNIYSLLQTVISAFLGIIGVLLLIYMLYAGYHWMTAQGEEEKVEKAKDTLKRAIIGAIIIIAAYAISIFVMGRLEAGTLAGGKSSVGGQGVQQNSGGGAQQPPASLDPEGLTPNYLY